MNIKVDKNAPLTFKINHIELNIRIVTKKIYEPTKLKPLGIIFFEAYKVNSKVMFDIIVSNLKMFEKASKFLKFIFEATPFGNR